jgi:hypothetical protein
MNLVPGRAAKHGAPWMAQAFDFRGRIARLGSRTARFSMSPGRTRAHPIGEVRH